MESPSQLAIRYGNKQWESITGQSFMPLELTQAIVVTVNATGYTKKLVDKLILQYRKSL